jgi:hypothetical protein
MDDSQLKWEPERPIFKQEPWHWDTGIDLQEGIYFNPLGEIYRLRVLGETSAVRDYANEVKIFCKVDLPVAQILPPETTGHLNKSIDRGEAQVEKTDSLIDEVVSHTRQQLSDDFLGDARRLVSPLLPAHNPHPAVVLTNHNQGRLSVDLDYLGVAETITQISDARERLQELVDTPHLGGWLQLLRQLTSNFHHGLAMPPPSFTLHFHIDPTVSADHLHEYTLHGPGKVTADLMGQGGGAILMSFIAAEADPSGEQPVAGNSSVTVQVTPHPGAAAKVHIRNKPAQPPSTYRLQGQTHVLLNLFSFGTDAEHEI